MATFGTAVMDGMLAELTNLVHHYAFCTALSLEREEFVSLFVQKEHVKQLLDVQEMVGRVASDQSNGFSAREMARGARMVTMQVTTPNGDPILVPAYARNGFSADAPSDLVEKFRDWADERLRVGNAAGLLRVALHWMNSKDIGSKAMSTIAPATLTLLARSPVLDRHGNKTDKTDNVDRATRITKSKSIGELPNLPGNVRRAVYAASQVVNSLVMVSDAKPVVCPKRGALISYCSADPGAIPEYVDFQLATGWNGQPI